MTIKAKRVGALCMLLGAAVLLAGTIVHAPSRVRGSGRRGARHSVEAWLQAADAARSQQRFELALRNLEQALAQAPQNVSAWQARAAVLIVRGRYPEARASCRALMAFASPSVVAACVAPIDALTGRYEVARHAVAQALQMAGSLEQQVALLCLQGELAFWAGDLELAERALASTLSLDPEHPKARALQADLLLDTGRAREALTALTARVQARVASSAPSQGDDALLLRTVLAHQQLGAARAAAAARARLVQDFDAARARGEFVQQREEARLFLAVRGQEQRALAAAQAAFRARQEPWDARILMEASLRTGELGAARPALDWLTRTGVEAPVLQRLAQQLAQPH